MISTDKTDLEKSKAMDIINHWRACHAYPINTFQATLRSRLKSICRTAIVGQRLKRIPSIIKKLQHSWATAVETMGMFLQQALKSSEGEEQWLQYFQVVSAAFSLLEKSPLPTAFSEISSKEICQSAIALTEQLDVKARLNAYALAANAIETRQSKGNYHLVVLDAKTRSVSIASYGRRRLDEAHAAYAEAERQSTDNPSIQAVLVATDSADALKRAYPNFFLDTRVFITELNKIQRFLDK